MLVSLSGQEVQVLANGNYAAGTHEASIDATQLASGAYTLVLRSNGVMATKAITVTK